jgi:hypothetical protein
MIYNVVYVDLKPDGTPFYVGKGTIDRVRKIKRNALHEKICKKYPGWVRGIAFGGSEKDCLKKEKELIAKFGRIDLATGTLANFTDGGEGTLNPSKQTKEKMKFAKLGTIRTNETKSKISFSMMGKKQSLGYVQSKEHRLKHSTAILGTKSVFYKGDIIATNIFTQETIILQGATNIHAWGFSASSVYACVNGKRKTHKGHIFKRLEKE